MVAGARPSLGEFPVPSQPASSRLCFPPRFSLLPAVLSFCGYLVVLPQPLPLHQEKECFLPDLAITSSCCPEAPGSGPLPLAHSSLSCVFCPQHFSWLISPEKVPLPYLHCGFISEPALSWSHIPEQQRPTFGSPPKLDSAAPGPFLPPALQILSLFQA